MEKEQKTIKIFISSPGDVVNERQIARRVIAKLGREFSAADIKLEALLWEDMPLQVTSSFQEGINQIVNTNLVDIAVFILWSRLGSPLKDFTKSDGSPYKSGTEYEFEMMYAANQQSGGTPAILAYIKNAPVSIVLSQSGNVDFEEIEQHKEAQRFIQEKFYDSQTKTIYGAYHQFDVPTTFEQKLTEHLRRLIIDKIGHEPTPIEWEGNPYVGLRSFRKDENAIFFGRKRAIEKIKKHILENTTQINNTASVFVLGESGSGKSSMIRAGLLPDIMDFGLNGHIEWNEPYDFSFSQFRGDIYNEIVKKITNAFPNLENTAIGKDLIAGKEINFNYITDYLVSNKSTIFFIDQFEELFTDPLITEEERIRVLNLLCGLAVTRKVWLFFAMRNDFYHKFTAYPTLLELKKESILYDLPKMRYSEFQEIVEEPAKKAGLKWEIKNGKELNKQIINDISSGIDDLPLIEFALSELYNLKDEKNQLTFEAYNKIGKINGAVIKYVDDFYNDLTEEEKNIFYQMLSALITPSAENENLYVRKTALRKDLQKSDKHKLLIDKLIEKHILVSGKDATEKEATVSIVHEILISQWQVIQDWINREKDFIRLNEYYENCANHWKDLSYGSNVLMKEKEAIRESEYYLMHWKENTSKLSLKYILDSIRKFNRKHLTTYIFIFSFLFISYISTLICVSTNNEFFYELAGEDFSWTWQYSFTFLIAFAFLIYMLWRKIKVVPIYKSIKVSLAFFLFLGSLSLIDAYNTITEKDVDVFFKALSLLLPLIIIFNLVQTILDYYAIKKWKKRILMQTAKINRISTKISAILSYVSIISLILITFLIQSYNLQEKQEKIDNAYRELDNTYENLEIISPNIPPNFRLHFNLSQLYYLLNNFGKELNDNVSNMRKYQYALCRYNLGHPEEIFDFLDVDSRFPDHKLAVLAAFELGEYDICRKLILAYKEALENTDNHSLDEFDVTLIWTAEKVSAFDLVKEVYNNLENIDYNGALVINKAHALLMTGDKENALSLYRKQLNDPSFNWKYEIEKDFSVFRWLGFPETEMSFAERELKLNRIKVYTNPKDEENTILTKSFIGKWQCEENGYLINWEITEDNYNLCFYLWQTKNITTNQWDDYDISVTRYRMKQEGNKIILEEYNSRTNTLSAAEIEKITDNEIRVKIIENGNPDMRGQIRVYKRTVE